MQAPALPSTMASHGLGLLDGLPIAGNVAGAGLGQDVSTQGAKVGGFGGSIEAARTSAQQKVKALQIQIQEATKASAGSLYFASSLPHKQVIHIRPTHNC